MGDFPKGGDIETTRAWLDKEGFFQVLKGWKADAIIGLEEEKLLKLVPGEDGWRLWGFLNTARLTLSPLDSAGVFFFRIYYLFMIISIIGYC